MISKAIVSQKKFPGGESEIYFKIMDLNIYIKKNNYYNKDIN